jgi:hypothetical protein
VGRRLGLGILLLQAAACSNRAAQGAPATPGASSAAPIEVRDFSFAQGSPFGGSTPTECGELTVSSTNTEPVGRASFRKNHSGSEAAVTFKFAKPIHRFRLKASNVHSDEYLGDFNLVPTEISGTLTLSGGRVSTSRPRPADGAGIVSWFGASLSTLTFTISGPTSSALAIDGFAVECEL